MTKNTGLMSRNFSTFSNNIKVVIPSDGNRSINSFSHQQVDSLESDAVQIGYFFLKSRTSIRVEVIRFRQNVAAAELSSKDLDQLRNWLAANYYSLGREWCYKSIHPRIMCEQYIEPKDPSLGLVDYKFFCFRGQLEFIQVDINRFSNHRRNLYDLSWNLIPVEFLYRRSDKPIPEPDGLDKMIEVSRRLSSGFTFLRVDLYSEQQIIFGEITFYPENGFGTFTPKRYDYIFGKLLKLPSVYGSKTRNQRHT